MGNVKNFVDEKTSRKIISALCALEYKEVLKLSEKSEIPVTRLLDFVDGDEKITQLDKGKLIIHLINLAEISIEEETTEKIKERFTTHQEFLLRKTG